MVKDEITETALLKKRNEELEQENQYLHQIIALMPGNVYWKSRSGVYLGCNENCAKLIGLKRAELINKTIYELTNPIFADEINAVDERIMQAGIAEIIEEKSDNLDGSSRTFLSHKTPLLDKNGKICGLHGVSLEITNLKNIEKELMQAKEKAEAANKAKSEFLRNISHDLRTPFNGILSFSERLYELETDPTKKEMLDCITTSTQTLVHIVNEILEVSKIELKQLPIKEEKFNLHQLITTLNKLFIVNIQEKNNRLTIVCPKHVPEYFIGDEMRLLRILMNLVGNALKFTANGSIEISVDIAQQLKGKMMVVLKVSDTGIGIPPDRFEFIFEKFSRLSLADNSGYEGLGLGLYIVKKFIDELHGNIDIKSELGKGSTFTCIIPLQPYK
jgi:two-component system, OmpR family, aerobic respiration control sensor histidine kinase ArcB